MRVDEFIPNSVKNVLNYNNSVNNQNNNDNSVNFGNVLDEKLNQLNDTQVNAQNMTNELVAGDDVDVHQVMLSTQEAKLSLELAIQVRNKLTDAYQELTKMQV